MNQTLLQKYGGNVPRYTSYPTAAQFHGGITAENYAGWLGEIEAEEAVSLYLHIPYCHKLCWYCACHTNITQKGEVVSRYKDLLLKELELVAGHLKGRSRLAHIHWGGGSPNMLEIDDFGELMTAISGCFRIEKATENAMEIDPRLLTREKAFGYVRAGVNRVSLGVQDFNHHVQKAINRIQPLAVTINAVNWLREAGVRRINFDLIYGLPGQSWKDILFTVDMAASLRPDRLAVFGYAHVPWMKPHQKLIDENILPRNASRLEMSQGMARRLTDHGYIQIGIDHFAKPGDPLAKAYKAGTLRRNFQGYTTDRAATLIGLGASAISHFRDGFGQNAADLKAYAGCIRAGRLATCRGVNVTQEDKRRWPVIEKLMCQFKITKKTLKAFKPEAAALAVFEQEGLIRRSHGDLVITESGRPYVRILAAVFDQYLQENTTRHSQVV